MESKSEFALRINKLMEKRNFPCGSCGEVKSIDKMNITRAYICDDCEKKLTRKK